MRHLPLIAKNIPQQANCLEAPRIILSRPQETAEHDCEKRHSPANKPIRGHVPRRHSFPFDSGDAMSVTFSRLCLDRCLHRYALVKVAFGEFGEPLQLACPMGVA